MGRGLAWLTGRSPSQGRVHFWLGPAWQVHSVDRGAAVPGAAGCVEALARLRAADRAVRLGAHARAPLPLHVHSWTLVPSALPPTDTSRHLASACSEPSPWTAHFWAPPPAARPDLHLGAVGGLGVVDVQALAVDPLHLTRARSGLLAVTLLRRGCCGRRPDRRSAVVLEADVTVVQAPRGVACW